MTSSLLQNPATLELSLKLKLVRNEIAWKISIATVLYPFENELGTSFGGNSLHLHETLIFYLFPSSGFLRISSTHDFAIPMAILNQTFAIPVNMINGFPLQPSNPNATLKKGWNLHDFLVQQK